MRVANSTEYRDTRYLESEEMKISSLTISVFCHETEDLDKIKTSIEDLFPSVKEADVRLEKVKGHFGNYITLLEYKFGKSSASTIFEEIVSKISSTDMIVIVTTLSTRMDKSKLYLRFDKQYLVGRKEITLKEGNDVVRVIVSFNEPFKEVTKELKQIASNRALHKETGTAKLS
ncbi:RNA-binding protein [Sulfuracidifex tepidarius]|uniref:RNA-binding protein n=3 Tax=Sulfuracidifex tepidarius TaxID=1294262 RepID=A0A510E534_9CREN|nr:RNA-binding protein [Sulfuracidifex tepidarius]BBG27180.1 RNA-binding protein [Sulfuracidifex tepidarius]